jgi:23S rRNA pseudouridine2604 synthase
MPPEADRRGGTRPDRRAPPLDQAKPAAKRRARESAPPKTGTAGTDARPQPTGPGDAGAVGAGERVAKRMASLGLASRREADAWIEAGWVRIDGRVAVLGERVGPESTITIDPAARAHQDAKVTILLNKPLDIVSGQAEDGHTDAASLIRADTRWARDASARRFEGGHARGLAPAGRLDVDSTGLLVLTQDGRVARRLVGEDGGVDKFYLVDVDWTDPAAWSDAALTRLRHGIELDDVALAPAAVDRIEGSVDEGHGRLRFVLREGRKRQIRRMCEAVGLRVTRLERVRIGRIELGELPPGCWRYLGDDEQF